MFNVNLLYSVVVAVISNRNTLEPHTYHRCFLSKGVHGNISFMVRGPESVHSYCSYYTHKHIYMKLSEIVSVNHVLSSSMSRYSSKSVSSMEHCALYHSDFNCVLNDIRGIWRCIDGHVMISSRFVLVEVSRTLQEHPDDDEGLEEPNT